MKKRTSLIRLLQDSNFQTTQDSRPSNFLFQIARGSGATLRECTFSSKKRTSPKKTSSRQTTSRPYDKKNPDRTISEFFLIKNPETCSGVLQRRIRAISIQDPLAPCSKQQEARGLHSVSSLFLQKRAHHSKGFFKTTIFKQHKIQDPPATCSK